MRLFHIETADVVLSVEGDTEGGDQLILVAAGDGVDIALLGHVIVLPELVVIAGDQNKGGVEHRIFQLEGGDLLDEGIIDPDILTIGHDQALVRRGGVPVETVWPLHQQIAAGLLQLLALAVIDGLGKFGGEEAHPRQLLFEIAGRIGPHLAAGHQQHGTHQQLFFHHALHKDALDKRPRPRRAWPRIV